MAGRDLQLVEQRGGVVGAVGQAEPRPAPQAAGMAPLVEGDHPVVLAEGVEGLEPVEPGAGDPAVEEQERRRVGRRPGHVPHERDAAAGQLDPPPVRKRRARRHLLTHADHAHPGLLHPADPREPRYATPSCRVADAFCDQPRPPQREALVTERQGSRSGTSPRSPSAGSSTQNGRGLVLGPAHGHPAPDPVPRTVGVRGRGRARTWRAGGLRRTASGRCRPASRPSVAAGGRAPRGPRCRRWAPSG